MDYRCNKYGLYKYWNQAVSNKYTELYENVFIMWNVKQ